MALDVAIWVTCHARAFVASLVALALSGLALGHWGESRLDESDGSEADNGRDRHIRQD